MFDMRSPPQGTKYPKKFCVCEIRTLVQKRVAEGWSFEKFG
jgi:hypothetical protein